MAKPTKYAPFICIICTVLALIGIIVGFIYSSPIITIILLLPTAIYEAYRTEGKYTTKASYILVLVLVAELALVIFKVNFNLAEFLGSEQKSIGNYLVPLGDIKVVGPTIMAILSVLLFTQTRGIYTKWLAVVIFVTAFAIVYVLDPVVFNDILKYGVNEGISNL